jgi:hypothetical protein
VRTKAYLVGTSLKREGCKVDLLLQDRIIRYHAMNQHAKPPFPRQKQPMPGHTGAMRPIPDHGESSYRSSEKGKEGGHNWGGQWIGRAVASAYAREGADVLLAF